MFNLKLPIINEQQVFKLAFIANAASVTMQKDIIHSASIHRVMHV